MTEAIFANVASVIFFNFHDLFLGFAAAVLAVGARAIAGGGFSIRASFFTAFIAIAVVGGPGRDRSQKREGKCR